MTDEVKKYFFEKYGKSKVMVVPGHWPDFKTKEEVDEWIGFIERVMGMALDEATAKGNTNA